MAKGIVMFGSLRQKEILIVFLLLGIVIPPTFEIPSGTKTSVVLTQEELAWLRDHPVIRLGVDLDNPPFEFMSEDGIYQGIASDMVRLVNDLLGIQMTVKPGLTWPRVLKEAKAQLIDVIPCVHRASESEEYLLFTTPYFNLSGILVTRTDAPYIGGLDDLSSKTVAVVHSYHMHECLRRNHSNLQLMPFSSAKEGLLAVSSGEAFTYAGDLLEVHYLTQLLGLSDLQVATSLPYSTVQCFGVRKDWPELVSILNKALAAISPEERKRISQKWMSMDYGATYAVLWRWTFPISLALALLFLLHVQVRLQTKGIKKTSDQLKNDLAESNRLLDEAAHYVNALLPSPMYADGITVNWRFKPSAALGGDCFGYHWLDEDHFAVYLLDVAGHGASASLLAVALLNVIRSETLKDTNYRSPGNVLESLNDAFQMDDHNGMYFTIWYGVYQKSRRILSYASGGHPPAILCSRCSDGSVTIANLMTPNLFIGGLPELEYEAATITVPCPSTFYVFSDGVFEITDRNDAMWGLKNFQEFMGQCFVRSEPALERLMIHIATLNRSESLDDDLSIIEIQFR